MRLGVICTEGQGVESCTARSAGLGKPGDVEAGLRAAMASADSLGASTELSSQGRPPGPELQLSPGGGGSRRRGRLPSAHRFFLRGNRQASTNPLSAGRTTALPIPD